MEEFEAAQDEWNQVQEIVPKFAQENNEQNAKNELVETPLIFVADFIQDFRNSIDLDLEEDFQNETENRKIESLISFIKCSCLQPRINENLENEKKLIFAISQKPFQDENPLHFQVLLTLYKLLTGSKLDCPRYGNHWEQIGFQGTDPATDLRGVGCLGLIQPLYLVMTPELHPLAKDIYLISLSETQNFPFLVLSINVTRIALHALRDGLLNR